MATRRNSTAERVSPCCVEWATTISAPFADLRDVYQHPRDVYQHPRGVYEHPRDVYEHNRDVYVHNRDVYEHNMGVYQHSTDVNQHSRHVYHRPTLKHPCSTVIYKRCKVFHGMERVGRAGE